jgi:hypothetical protein
MIYCLYAQAAIKTALIFVPYTVLTRGCRGAVSTSIRKFVDPGIARVFAAHVSSLLPPGVFTWLVADSTDISLQEAAQYADAAVLATGYWFLRSSPIFNPAVLLFLQFNTTGSAPKSLLGEELAKMRTTETAPAAV